MEQAGNKDWLSLHRWKWVQFLPPKRRSVSTGLQILHSRRCYFKGMEFRAQRKLVDKDLLSKSFSKKEKYAVVSVLN
jgi:hypothetical protein